MMNNSNRSVWISQHRYVNSISIKKRWIKSKGEKEGEKGERKQQQSMDEKKYDKSIGR